MAYFRARVERHFDQYDTDRPRDVSGENINKVAAWASVAVVLSIVLGVVFVCIAVVVTR